MDRDLLIEQLRTTAAHFRGIGVTGLYLYGSAARGEAGAGSDVDLFIDLADENTFTLMDLVGAKYLLEEQTGKPVDIATREGIHPRIRAKVEREALRIF